MSTADQNTERQLDGVALDRVFTDHFSGAPRNRPALEDLRRYVREGDTVLVHPMARAGRSETYAWPLPEAHGSVTYSVGEGHRSRKVAAMLAGCTRVSETDGSQTTNLQSDALLAAGVGPERIYQDLASGGRDDPTGLAESAGSDQFVSFAHIEGTVGRRPLWPARWMIRAT